jgi:hypothetical protein
MTNNSLLNTSSDRNDEDNPLFALKKELTARKEKREAIEALMEQFCKQLYSGFESAVAQTTATGVPGLGKPRRIPHPSGDWRQALQVFIEDWSVIIVPLVGSAWPNPRDEARITPYRFKEPCGRIAVFIGDDPNAESFYDFLVFSDGYWFAWGYGWPRTNDDMTNTDFDTMALELLVSFVKDIHATWRPRRVIKLDIQPVGTHLSQSLDAKKRAYNWGLPGEE